jgi:hypothetical protein
MFDRDIEHGGKLWTWLFNVVDCLFTKPNMIEHVLSCLLQSPRDILEPALLYIFGYICYSIECPCLHVRCNGRQQLSLWRGKLQYTCHARARTGVINSRLWLQEHRRVGFYRLMQIVCVLGGHELQQNVKDTVN